MGVPKNRWGFSLMRVPLPDLSVYGIFEYLLLGLGVRLGGAIFEPAMKSVEQLIGGLRD